MPDFDANEDLTPLPGMHPEADATPSQPAAGGLAGGRRRRLRRPLLPARTLSRARCRRFPRALARRPRRARCQRAATCR